MLIAPIFRRSERMVLPLWRSLHSLNLMLPKEDRKAMLLRLYNEDTPLMDHSKDRFSRDRTDANVKDEPADETKDEGGEEKEGEEEEEEEEEEEVDADVKDEMGATKREGGEGTVADADVETVENGTFEEEREREQDDAVSDAVKA